MAACMDCGGSECICKAARLARQAENVIGAGPYACGYTWDAERQVWHRPWNDETLAPDDAPESWKEWQP